MFGKDIWKITEEERYGLRKRFGVLFQDGALLGSMSLFDNVAFPLRKHTDVPAEDAAGQILAANVGVTLSLITMPEPDFGLSIRVRESVLAGVLHVDDQATGPSRASAAVEAQRVEGEPRRSSGPGWRLSSRSCITRDFGRRKAPCCGSRICRSSSPAGVNCCCQKARRSPVLRGLTRGSGGTGVSSSSGAGERYGQCRAHRS